MTSRRLPITLVVLGAVILLASIIAAVVVRASDTVTLALGERPQVPVVITEPGVLDAVDPAVTVRATAEDDEPVILAIGRTSEVEAWLGDGDHVRVSGLSSWQELTSETVLGPEPTDAPEDAAAEDAEEPAPGTVPNPAGSDLWVVEASGTGTAELGWTDSPGRWSLVAATDGTGPAPLVELEWGRQVSTPWLIPGIVVGAGLLVAGVTMLVLRGLAEREQRRRDEARARREGGELEDTGSVLASISDTDPGTGERLSRRQIREMERVMAQADRRRRAGEDVPPPIPFTEPGAGTGRGGADPGPADLRPADPVPADLGRADPVPADLGSGGVPDTELEDTDDSSGPARDEPAADRAGGPPIPDGATEADEEAEDQPEELPTPSWRSVWGFSDPTAPPDQPDHDREERG